jgi:3' terminal RNA ribose 2'-O-methyltransferase Hen1
MPLELQLSAVRAHEGILEKLFEPLGYEVESTPLALDASFPEWGTSPYRRVTLRGTKTVHDAITHLYVLLPVLDGQKHYYIGDDEVEKLLRHGEGWLAAHPAKEQIVGRYLKRRRSLVQDAMQQLLASEEAAEVEAIEESRESAGEQEERIEQTISLHTQRLDTVAATLTRLGVKRIVDFGCGSGKLIARLLENPQFTEIVGVDVAHVELERASAKLKLEQMPPHRRDRVKLLQGSLVYKDSRLHGFDAIAMVEVIEHLDPPRIAFLERAVFGAAQPRHILVTTPNREYNTKFPGMAAGQLRHRDHRFEWTRAEFQAWASAAASAFGYTVAFEPLGPLDEQAGAPSQMAVFTHAN